MFLKKLVLNGFKSFADYSEINFVKGISAIVGPNGCGKSNLIDAIIWVIGEQKTRTLRASSMSDVIFKGTDYKKGLGRAEVRLTLVNEQNILPVDFNEVEVARIIFANGENEYYINKKRVRLKDLQELFFDTGVGKSSYSVMAQGKIDMILSNKPEDRRFIIEEAAGITKYRVKRYEALTRLRQTNENITRSKDIIEEVKTQYDHMKKQAEKAEKYKDYHEKEINLEIELNLNRIQKYKNTQKEYEEKFEEHSKELNEIKEKLDELENSVEEQLVNLTDFENEKIENQREVFKINSEIQVLKSKKDIFLEQIKHYEIAIKSDSEKLKQYQESLVELTRELSSVDSVKEELDDKLDNLMDDKDIYIENVAKIEQEIKKADGRIEVLKQENNQASKDLNESRKEQKKATDDLIVKIDESLNVFDINSDEMKNFKQLSFDNLSYIIQNLPQKRAFIDDIVKSGYVSKDSDEFLNLLGKFQEELIIIEEKVKSADENIKNYIDKIEEYLNDIFGPDGILQKKRKIEQNIEELSEKISVNTQEIEDLRSDIIVKRDKKEDLNKVLNDVNINISTLAEKKNSIDNDVKRLLTMKNQQESSVDEFSGKLKFYKEKIDEVKEDIEDISDRIGELNVKKEQLEKSLIDTDRKIRDENMRMSEQQRDIKVVNNKWISMKEKAEKVNLKITEAKTTISNIYENFYENYSIDLIEYESKEGFSSRREFDIIKKELSEIKSKKHSLGSVNLIAIEEAKTLEERYNLLNKQLKDLEEAKKDIDKMMEKVNKISEELFVKTFNEIKTNFHRIFRKLFDGGQAEINLTDPDKILETGIDIIAHPPGQKTQNITLLSGGQRTMTAIALMFATFLVKPSPFCLLDEIDAALDEENINRFIKLLHEMKDTSQFMIITHNKKTISAADVMYGVTQEQKGISKVVSQKIVEKIG